MYSGIDWEDGVTLPGWKACTAENNGIDARIPNLESTFIMGTNTNDIKVTDKRTGGNNELTKDQMPRHNHNIDHDHPPAWGKTYGTNDGNHSHSANLPIGSTGNLSFDHVLTSDNAKGNDNKIVYDGIISSSNHSHNVSVDLDSTSGFSSGTSGNGMGTGKESKMDNRPQYYTVIYIIKVSN